MTELQPKRPLALVVEDDSSFRGVLALLLESDGWRVVEAGDGERGLELARQLHPDVVVTDLSMPRMSGIELAERLATNGGADVRILAITSAASGMRDAARKSGLFVRVMTKPVSPLLLLTAVREAARSSPEA
jgi:CheY-like chemotaxis protein